MVRGKEDILFNFSLPNFPVGTFQIDFFFWSYIIVFLRQFEIFCAYTSFLNSLKGQLYLTERVLVDQKHLTKCLAYFVKW